MNRDFEAACKVAPAPAGRGSDTADYGSGRKVKSVTAPRSPPNGCQRWLRTNRQLQSRGLGRCGSRCVIAFQSGKSPYLSGLATTQKPEAGESGPEEYKRAGFGNGDRGRHVQTNVVETVAIISNRVEVLETDQGRSRRGGKWDRELFPIDYSPRGRIGSGRKGRTVDQDFHRTGRAEADSDEERKIVSLPRGGRHSLLDASPSGGGAGQVKPLCSVLSWKERRVKRSANDRDRRAETVQPVIMVLPVGKFVKFPCGTVGVSKLPLVRRFA